jgi:hypothetical protein
VIVSRRQSSGEIFLTRRKIGADDKTRLDGVTLDGEIIEQATQTDQMVGAGAFVEGWILFTQPTQPAQHMRIAAELRDSADIGKGGAQIS